MATRNESVASQHGMPIPFTVEAGRMRIMVGTANLNQSAKAAKTRSTSMRLTKALAHQQEE